MFVEFLIGCIFAAGAAAVCLGIYVICQAFDSIFESNSQVQKVAFFPRGFLEKTAKNNPSLKNLAKSIAAKSEATGVYLSYDQYGDPIFSRTTTEDLGEEVYSRGYYKYRYDDNVYKN